LQDYRAEGEETLRLLVQELHTIHTRQQLIAASSTLKQLFQELVEVMIAAEEYRDKHSQEEELFSGESSRYSNLLFMELNRIYQIEEGMRELVEKCQQDALNRLDGY
jgi:hypothetical protein